MTLLAFADRVQETAQNVGTASSVTLLGAAAGNLRTFADAGLTGKTVPYALQHRTSGQWEIGYGIYALGGLTRAVVFCNSDGTTALVNFSSGIVDVWNDLPAEKIVAQDADSNHVTLPGGITVNGPIVATGPITAPGGVTGPVAWTNVTGTPTTIAGYGITDAYTKSASDARFAPIAVPWLTITGTPTTLAGYGITDAFTKTQSDARYLQTAGTVPWGMVTGTPTTLNGYGITDAYTKAQADAKFALTPTPWGTITGTPTTLFGYGITDAYTKTTSDALYAFKGGPFAWSGVTGTPTTLAGYGITDAFTKTESDARYASSGAVYVNSITGTAGRITVTGPASAPIVNIDPAYVGQFSITTVGTITTGVWNGAVIATTFGGTGLAAYAAGDLLYASAANTLAKRAIGTPNQFLAVAGGFPSWHTLVAADISDLASAGTGITVVGTITTGTWHGTPIEPAYGGTGLTSYAKGDLIYASAVNTLANLVVGGAAQVLTVTAGVPAWHTLVTADITDLATAATGITKVGTITTGTWAATPVAPQYGGTGLSAYSLGDLIIGSGINTLARLAGPTALTRTFLMSAGTGSAATAPVWTTITTADIGAGTFGGAAYTFSGNLTVAGTLTTGAITASSVHVTGPLTVDGAVTFNGGVTTTGTISGGIITATPNFVVTGTAAQSRGLAFQTGGSNRWYAWLGGPEGGSNAGGDFTLSAYTDAAVLIDNPINILRVAGGLMTVNRPVTITGVTTATFFYANGGPPQSNGFVVATGGVPRWTFQGNGGAESGSNAGTDLLIAAYGDGGSKIDTPLSITRAAGGSIFLGRPLSLNSGDLTIAPTFKLVLNSAPASGSNAIQLQAGGVPRWNIRRSGNAESGADAGSDFVIEAWHDNGTLSDQPLFISRSVSAPIFISRTTVIGTDPGGTALFRVGGGINAQSVGVTSGYYINGNPTLTGTATYTDIKSPDATDAILIGSASDQTNYYGNTSHHFRNRAGNVDYARIDANGLVSNAGIQVLGLPGTFPSLSTANAYVALANGATMTFPGGYGLLYLADGTNTGNAALYLYSGSGVAILLQQGAEFSAIANNAGTINVYYAGGMTIQNKMGSNISILRIINLIAG